MNICLSCEGVTATAAERCGHCGVSLLPLDSVHYPERRGEADAGNPLLGSVVDGKYRLEGVLGRGGLGTVFQAEHIGSLMKVALKLLHPKFSEHPEYRRGLLPEARRAATVTNERCARLLDVGETSDGGTYLAMELVQGATLDELVRDGRLMPSHAVDILVQVAEALVAIHAVGLVHCDLSPRNVMVAVRNGELVAKVLDFGIARPVSMPAAKDLAVGGFSGFVSPAFSAPEHLAGQTVDSRADFYSFGALAWLMLTGKAPIDDGDPLRAVRAAVAGELEPWPGVPGVPRRLHQLIARCLALNPDDRPQTAAALLRELLIVRGARSPVLARTATTGLAIAVFAALPALFTASTQPFLEAVAGSPLTLTDTLPDEPRYLQSSRLAKLQFHFGGFSADSLRLDVSQGGAVLLRAPLRPEVDAEGGVLTLATAQPDYSSVVQSLLDSSRDGAVDLSFVVAGFSPLGSSRLRLDDEPPVVAVQPVEGTVVGDVLTAGSGFAWSATDNAALAGVEAIVVLEDREEVRFSLVGAGGTFSLGAELASILAGAGSRGRVQVVLAAEDLAGNSRRVDVVDLPRCDFRAPAVVGVTGAAGEPFLPCLGGVARLRIELSESEAGCELSIVGQDGRHIAQRELDDGLFQEFEIPVVGPDAEFISGSYVFLVEDGAGNRSAREFSCIVRDRSLGLEFLGEGQGFATSGDELLVQRAGASVMLRCSEAYEVVRASLVTAGSASRGLADAVEFVEESPGLGRLTFTALPVGAYRLELELREVGIATGDAVVEFIAVRVLPDVFEIRIARAGSRFLPALVRAGVLSRGEAGYREGAGWSVPPELLPLLRGTVWIGMGDDVLVPLPLNQSSSRAGSILPEFVPLPGRTLIAVSLRDILERPVRVLVGDVPAPRRELQGRQADLIADFWWHDQPPEQIGEELLVEHGQPARLRLRMPLPYRATDREDLRIGLAQSEIVASAVAPEGLDAAVVTFDLPFVAWSVAAQLVDRPREAYADQVPRRVDVYVQTPVARYDLQLSLRTTRSTLRPIRLGELADLPADLADLQLVPVLGPDLPFVDPVPLDSPPRAVFRPQVSVDVRNLEDFLLQDREITCGEARRIVSRGLPLVVGFALREVVHADDPLGASRLTKQNMLPPQVWDAPAEQTLTRVNFYQAYACCRLLGLVVAGEPGLFRLPMGIELELAAFGASVGVACNGPAARGEPVAMSEFVAAAELIGRGEVADARRDRRAGDVAPTAYASAITGLDFGVREWVADLPHIEGAELLLREWNADHGAHIARVQSYAAGRARPPEDLVWPLSAYGVVRGLALGELDGLLDDAGRRLEAGSLQSVPASVPGVLRTEQLRRDGRDLLSAALDPRLQVIGFRVAGTAVLVARLRGRE